MDSGTLIGKTNDITGHHQTALIATPKKHYLTYFPVPPPKAPNTAANA